MKTIPTNKFGKYKKKAQSGLTEGNTGVGQKPAPNSNSADWFGIISGALPILANGLKPVQNTNSISTGNTKIDQSNLIQAYNKDATKNAQTDQLANGLLSTGVGVGLSALGVPAPLAFGIGNAFNQFNDAIYNKIAPSKEKYGIKYYDGNTAGGRFGEATGGESNPFLAGYNAITGKGKEKNEKAKEKIATLDSLKDTFNRINQYETQGIYAKKGARVYKFGRFGMHQVTNVPRHKDNVVLDAESGEVIPSAKKGAGGYLIPFGRYNKKKVLIENGEYVLKDETNSVVAVFPKSIGEKIKKGKLTIEEALEEVPHVNNAPSVPVKAQTGVQEEKPSLMEKMLNEQNPLLYALLQKNSYQKPIVKKGIKEFINEDGYLKNSKNKKNPLNIIPSNIITTRNMAGTIVASDGVTTKVLKPNTGIYKFNNSPVVEFKIGKCGMKSFFGKYKKAQDGVLETEFNPFIGLRKGANYSPFGVNPIITQKQPNIFDKLYNNTIQNTYDYYYNNPEIIKEQIESSNNDKINATAKTNETGNPVETVKKITTLRKNNENYPIETVKKTTTFIPNPEKPDYGFNSVPTSRRYIGLHGLPSYLLAAYQFYNAYKSKPSDRPMYQYDPVVAEIGNKYRQKMMFGDKYAYDEAKKQALASKQFAMRQANNSNLSAQTYLATLANIAGQTASANNQAYDMFIRKPREQAFKDYETWSQTQHIPEKRFVFQDQLNRVKELQDFQTNRYAMMQQALGAIAQYAQNDRQNKINQMKAETEATNQHTAQLAEFYLVYGNPKEREWAVDYMKNPLKYRAYVAPDVIGLEGKIGTRYKKSK